MIDRAVEHIAECLNQFLKREFQETEDKAVVSNIVDQDGAVVSDVENKILIQIVYIEKDTTPDRGPLRVPSGPGTVIQNPAPLHLNLYLMFSAHFNGANYMEALKFLSQCIPGIHCF